MDVTVIFKGGSMDGVEITYQSLMSPTNAEQLIVRSTQISEWGRRAEHEVYTFVYSLLSWVYDHNMEVVEEE